MSKHVTAGLCVAFFLKHLPLTARASVHVVRFRFGTSPLISIVFVCVSGLPFDAASFDK